MSLYHIIHALRYVFPGLQGSAILYLWLGEFLRKYYVHVGNDMLIVFFTIEMRKRGKVGK